MWTVALLVYEAIEGRTTWGRGEAEDEVWRKAESETYGEYYIFGGET